MNELVAKMVQAYVLVAGLLWSGLCAAECRILPPHQPATASPSSSSSEQRHLPPCHQKQKQGEKNECGAAVLGDIAKDLVDAPAPDWFAASGTLGPYEAAAVPARCQQLLPAAAWNPPQQGPPGAYSILRT